MSDTDDGDEYAGPAEVQAETGAWAVRVTLTGRFEPVDGRYHWAGRILPHSDVESLVRTGKRQVTVRISDRAAVPARLAEVDPWGGVRVVGVNRPPWR